MHHFGAEVRRAREAAGMSQSELGDLVPCDKATVSRVEAGLTVPDSHFAEVCSAAFANEWFSRFWADSQTWDASFPEQFREFAEYESEATALWLFEHTLVPGLLQTEDYARTVLGSHPHVTPGEVTERVAARMARRWPPGPGSRSNSCRGRARTPACRAPWPWRKPRTRASSTWRTSPTGARPTALSSWRW
jgi:transcriptional regulator with XRE-family HTH domain